MAKKPKPDKDLKAFLKSHESECLAAIEAWMLEGLDVPCLLVRETWADPAWRTCFENAVVRCGGTIGFAKGIDEKGRALIVDADGETRRIAAQRMAILHPVVIDELDAFRELAAELSLSQGILQLQREVWRKADSVDPEARSLDSFSGGRFEKILFVNSKAATAGARVRGGYATLAMSDGGTSRTARLWIGSGAPEEETETGELEWIGADEEAVRLGDVGPVAWSEGCRMAATIFAGRKIEEEAAK